MEQSWPLWSFKSFHCHGRHCAYREVKPLVIVYMNGIFNQHDTKKVSLSGMKENGWYTGSRMCPEGGG